MRADAREAVIVTRTTAAIAVAVSALANRRPSPVSGGPTLKSPEDIHPEPTGDKPHSLPLSAPAPRVAEHQRVDRVGICVRAQGASRRRRVRRAANPAHES